jgi:Chlamydia CHLPS protein (DUF818)
MSVKVNPIYAQFFPEEKKDQVANWENFKSPDEHFTGSIYKKGRTVDFSVDTRTWTTTLFKLKNLLINLNVFVGALCAIRYRNTIRSHWSKSTSYQNILAIGVGIIGIYKGLELTRYVISRIAMSAIYPIQSRIINLFSPENIDEFRITCMSREKRITRDVILEKDGVRYNGLLFGGPDTIENGKWVLQATGNFEAIEYMGKEYFEQYQQAGYNTLLINGPHVVRSEGQATPRTMGEAQEIGIQFLETALKAKRIVLAGFSLGGCAMGQAILQHKFKKDVDYLNVMQMTFASISHIANDLTGVPKAFIKAIGLEADSVASSEKLTQLNIRQVIIQATIAEKTEPKSTTDFSETDGLISAEASLGRVLMEKGRGEHQQFIGLPIAIHGSVEAFVVTSQVIKDWDKN